MRKLKNIVMPMPPQRQRQNNYNDENDQYRGQNDKMNHSPGGGGSGTDTILPYTFGNNDPTQIEPEKKRRTGVHPANIDRHFVRPTLYHVTAATGRETRGDTGARQVK
mmetsp:Transcript_37983/g.46413  ORF Transcript_37983/g.46413 Transcript_37983/m.46413 type:complete len:108 (+) Transcript_37983:401-724(+)